MKQETFLVAFQKKCQKKIVTLENKLEKLEQNPNCIFNRNYLDYKNKLEQI